MPWSSKLWKHIYQRRCTPLPDICGHCHKDRDQILFFEHEEDGTPVFHCTGTLSLPGQCHHCDSQILCPCLTMDKPKTVLISQLSRWKSSGRSRISQFSINTAWKWRNFGSEGGTGVLHTRLIRHWRVIYLNNWILPLQQSSVPFARKCTIFVNLFSS